MLTKRVKTIISIKQKWSTSSSIHCRWVPYCSKCAHSYARPGETWVKARSHQPMPKHWFCTCLLKDTIFTRRVWGWRVFISGTRSSSIESVSMWVRNALLKCSALQLRVSFVGMVCRYCVSSTKKNVTFW